jgi:hypothetical protein
MHCRQAGLEVGRVATPLIMSALLGSSAQIASETPSQSADNASTGIWKSFEARRKCSDLYNAATQLLLKRLKITLPTADKGLLSHPILGLTNFAYLQISNYESSSSDWNGDGDAMINYNC